MGLLTVCLEAFFEEEGAVDFLGAMVIKKKMEG